MSDNIQLETRNVGDLTGKFFLPAYQRGYRWGKDEIKFMRMRIDHIACNLS